MNDIPPILKQFAIPGDCISLQEITTGHIHRTFLGTWSDGRRYVHQLFNDHVFADVHGVGRNIELILHHLAAKGERTLTPIPLKGGGYVVEDESEFWWRTFEYIEQTESFNQCPDAAMAHDAAFAFGRFQALLWDLPPGGLIEPIPGFMDCQMRFHALEQAVQSGSTRLDEVRPEVAFAHQREALSALICPGAYGSAHQKKPTHGDMKLNNLLFSKTTRKPVCVIDLDTCMEGSYLYDFGDMVRIACSSAIEDEQDLSCVDFRIDLFEGIVSGYAESMGNYLTPFEKSKLVEAAKLLTLTIGVRFLTDYLTGDTYFRIDYPEHNLVRTRAQFALVKKIEAYESTLQAIVKKQFYPR